MTIQDARAARGAQLDGQCCRTEDKQLQSNPTQSRPELKPSHKTANPSQIGTRPALGIKNQATLLIWKRETVTCYCTRYEPRTYYGVIRAMQEIFGQGRATSYLYL